MSPGFASFDPYRFNLNSNRLFKAGQPVSIQELPLQVLRMLVLAKGAVVTREELCGVLWPKHTFVDFEHGLNTAVKKLRQALEDSAEDPRFIGTLPRSGYRFLAPLIWEEEQDGSSATSSNAIPPPEHQPILSLRDTDVAKTRTWKLAAVLAVAFLAVVLLAVLAAWAMPWIGHGGALHVHAARLLSRAAAADAPADPTSLTQRRLTANPTDAPLTAGLISPDGKYLAFSDVTGIYLRHVDTGETFTLHLPQGFEALPSDWFPDSTHLLLSRFDDAAKKPPSLWKISILGGIPRKLVEEGFTPTISPDGATLAFLTGPWDAQTLWLGDTETNSARRFAEAGEGSSFGPAAWSPDGHCFATVRATHRAGSEALEKRLEVFDVASAHSEAILSDPQIGRSLLWLASGRLIYSRQEPLPNQEDSNLWAMELHAGTNQARGSPARLTNGSGPIASISVTADGKHMAVFRRSTQTDVYVTAISAADDAISEPRRLTLDERQDDPSSWTDDSRGVLFTSTRDGPTHIFKQDATQTQPERLVGGTADLFLPRLSPDGTMLLYLTGPSPGEPSGHTHIMRVPMSGGTSSSLLEGMGIVNFQCAKAPSTVCLYGQDDAATYRFWLFSPVDGSRSELLSARRNHEDGPNSWALSPDGRYLVSVRSQDPYKASVLLLLDLAKGSMRELTVPEVKLIIGLSFAADSRKIWVSGFLGRGARETRSGLFTIDLEGRVTKIFERQNLAIFAGIPSPDGRSLALGVESNTSNVWLLEHF